jgi:rRNA maturation endonuclease Nob1
MMSVREELIRDLGGLALEMYRRDQFREDLLAEQARDIANIELRLHELDSMLAAAAAGRRASGSRCACGAPVLWGSHFCANCGRPVGEAAVISCTRCGHPLPGDAEFCPSCGKEAELAAADLEADDADAAAEAASAEPEAADPEADGEATVIGSAPEPRRDPWE